MTTDADAGRSAVRGQAAKVAVVAEDDPGVRLLIAMVLGAAGWEVHTTDTGRNVVELIERYSPVLCLLDIMMPGTNGIDAMVTARERGHGSEDGTVFVMLTALDGGDDVQQAVLSGADDYITKPFDVDDLAPRLARWCAATGWDLADPDRPGEVHDHLLFGSPSGGPARRRPTGSSGSETGRDDPEDGS